MLLQNENTIEIASNKLLSNREYENENNFTIEIQQTNRTNLQIYYGDTNIENYLKNNPRAYCYKCDNIKLPRTHHCRLCNKCVLRMDHHCPWTANCVGLKTHKFFCLFLFYAILSLLNVTIFTTDKYFSWFLEIKNESSILEVICYLLAIGLLISLPILLILHLLLLRNNLTTLDIMDKKMINENPYIIPGGCFENLKEVFGTNIIFWLIPIKPKLEEKLRFVSQVGGDEDF